MTGDGDADHRRDGPAGAGPVASGRRAVAAGPVPRRDAGSVTAELAVGLVGVVLVLALVLVGAAAAGARLRCQEAARTGARIAALGSPDADVQDAVRAVAGPDAAVEVVRDPPWVEVRVTGTVAGGWFTGGPLEVSGSATSWVEP